MNGIKTFLLLGLLTVVLILLGGAIAGRTGLIIALFFSVILNFVSYFFSSSIIISMYGAKPITTQRSPELYNIVHELTTNARIPMPKLYYMDSPSPNAFATGRNPDNAAVVVTTGLLNILNTKEVRGVIAHELAHIKNRDILISCVASMIAGTITTIANFSFFFGSDNNRGFISTLIFMILAPFAALLIQMAISRGREYIADETGAKISHDPNSLADALEKLSSEARRVPLLQASQTTSHMFIVKPLNKNTFANLFSTHPPINERIRRLRNM